MTERALREAILANEPRVTAVTVTYVNSDTDSLQFDISARLVDGRRKKSIAFRTKLGPGSNVKIQD